MSEKRNLFDDDWANVPVCLKPKQVADLTNLPRDIVYQLLRIEPEEGGLPHLVVGSKDRPRFLIYKGALRKWLCEASQEGRELY